MGNIGPVTANNKRIARNTLFLYVRLILVMVVSLYTVRIVLNALGVVDYGIYNVVGGFVSMFGFLNTSMANGIQRFYNYEMGSNGEASISNVYKTAVAIQLCLVVLIIVVAELFGVWYLNNVMVIPAERISSANWVFQFSMLSLIMTIAQVPYSAAILAYEKMDYYAIVSVIDVLLKLAIAIGLMYYGSDKLFLYGLLLLLIQVLNFFLYYIYCHQKFRYISFKCAEIKRNMFKNMLTFSGWNTLGSFAFMLKSQGVNILINSFFGAAINAANGIATQISFAIQSFSLSVVVAFKPQLTQAYASQNYNRARNMMFSMTKVSFLLLYTLSVPILLEIDYILHLWLGDVIPDYTIPFSRLILVVMLVSCFGTPLVQMAQAVGQMKRYQITTSVIICMILPLSWVALHYGADVLSVYWVTLGVVIINQAMCMRVLHSLFEYSYKAYCTGIILPCVVYAVILPIIPYLLMYVMDSSIYRLLVICVTTLLFSLLTSYILVLSTEEKQMFKQLLAKYINKIRA